MINSGRCDGLGDATRTDVMRLIARKTELKRALEEPKRRRDNNIRIGIKIKAENVRISSAFIKCGKFLHLMGHHLLLGDSA
jgi:hypothetical protein